MVKLLTVVLFIIVNAFSFATPSFAAGVTVTVECLTGQFLLPKKGPNLRLKNFVGTNVYQQNQPSLGSAALDKVEQQLHDNCYRNSRKWNHSMKYVAFPLTRSRGPLEQTVTVVACFEDGGGYVYKKILTPAKNFKYTFSETDKKGANDPSVKRLC